MRLRRRDQRTRDRPDINDETPQSEDEFDFAPPIEAVEAVCGCASEDARVDGDWIRSTSYVSNTTLGLQRVINKRIRETTR